VTWKKRDVIGERPLTPGSTCFLSAALFLKQAINPANLSGICERNTRGGMVVGLVVEQQVGQECWW